MGHPVVRKFEKTIPNLLHVLCLFIKRYHIVWDVSELQPQLWYLVVIRISATKTRGVNFFCFPSWFDNTPYKQKSFSLLFLLFFSDKGSKWSFSRRFYYTNTNKNYLGETHHALKHILLSISDMILDGLFYNCNIVFRAPLLRATH